MSASKEKIFPFVEIGIKTILVIHIENIKILSYIINIPCVLQHKIYNMYKGTFTRSNLLADNIIDQRDTKLPRLIT